MITVTDIWSQTQGAVAERLSALRAHVVVESELGPIPAAEIKKLWSRWMVLARCRLFVLDNSPERLGDGYTPEQRREIQELRVVCQATADSLQGDVFADLDPTDPKAEADMQAYLGALEAAGVLTLEQVASTWALGVRETRPFAHVGLPDLHKAGLITAAEAGVNDE
jgi:hypothetical protein